MPSCFSDKHQELDLQAHVEEDEDQVVEEEEEEELEEENKKEHEGSNVLTPEPCSGVASVISEDKGCSPAESKATTPSGGSKLMATASVQPRLMQKISAKKEVTEETLLAGADIPPLGVKSDYPSELEKVGENKKCTFNVRLSSSI